MNIPQITIEEKPCLSLNIKDFLEYLKNKFMFKIDDLQTNSEIRSLMYEYAHKHNARIIEDFRYGLVDFCVELSDGSKHQFEYKSLIL